MKRLLFLIASVVMFAFGGVPEAKAQWEQIEGPYYTTSFASIGSYLFDGDCYCQDGYGGVYLSTDSGINWTYSWYGNNFPDEVQACALAVNDTTLYLCPSGLGGDIYFSTDLGKNWVWCNNYEFGFGIYNNTLVVNGNNVFDGTNSGVYSSTNNGTSWTDDSAGLTNDTITALAMIGTNLFAGTSGGIVFLSTDSGGSWVATDSVLVNHLIYTFASSGINLFVGTSGGVFLSTNNGTSWMPSSNGLTNTFVFSLVVSGSYIFAGTYGGGVFLSTDSGKNWVSVNDSLTVLKTFPLYAFGGYLFVGTEGGGLFRRPLSDFTSSAVSSAASIENHLTTYPNPFPQSTTITLTTPAIGVVELSVVNVLGEEVARLYDGELGAGEHSFIFNASGFPPGTYWCVMRSNGLTQELPMVLSR